jgi:hypothetical protein
MDIARINQKLSKRGGQKTFQFFSDKIKESPGWWLNHVMIANDKLFTQVQCFNGEYRPGVLIIPSDGSYVRFISDTWYDGIDIENL